MFKKAFTLAEVLIALCIIGVIAAVTIPNLMGNTSDKEFKIMYKKAYQKAGNVLTTALNDDVLTPQSGQYDATANRANFNAFKSYFIITKECVSNNNDECWDSSGEKILSRPTQDGYAFIDSSGMAWSQYNYSENIIVVDTNGFKSPNKYGKDRWILVFKDATNTRITTGIPAKIGTYSNDITATGVWFCPSPPCYFAKYLHD